MVSREVVIEKEPRMILQRTNQTIVNEPDWCEDLDRIKNWNQFASDGVSPKNEASQKRYEELFHVAQPVFSNENQAVGQIFLMVRGAAGKVSNLIVRTSRFWGRNKICPIELVSDVTRQGVLLLIDRMKFRDLPDYKTDAQIEHDVKRALWNDDILRVTDDQEVNVQVKNGIVSLSGHIRSMVNQRRIENAVRTVKGILGVRIHLIEDEKLLFKVAEALIQIERIRGCQIFTKVENGVVGLSGHVVNADARSFTEKCAANVPWVRGVINQLSAPGIDQNSEDHRFLQPSIGTTIYFRDGLFGIVRQVIINLNNRRVTGMILEGRFPDKQVASSSLTDYGNSIPERLRVIPVSAIRYLTHDSGFLLIDSTEFTKYQDFDPAYFVAPAASWLPPYPYCKGDVRLLAEGRRSQTQTVLNEKKFNDQRSILQFEQGA
jgi:osmotically-inducible protein OsmY